jgi:hypothetical protein
MNIIDPTIFAPDKVAIPQDATQEQWAEIHRSIILCRKASGAWLKQSREYGVGRWGAEYVGEQEVQMEMALGLPAPEDKPTLNPADKSKAIVTIEGISHSFALWQRKMGPEIEHWNREQLTKALPLLEPIEAQAKRIRERLGEF